jgi:outer membrane protein assembly factor BamB
MERSWRRFVLAWTFAVALAITSLSGAADWPRYGGDDQLTNDVSAARAGGLSSETAARIVERWSAPLGGRFVASPLYAEDVSIGGQFEDLVYAATGTGAVVALRADDGTVLWKRDVSGTVTTCGSTYGISSTPVLDRTRNLLYAVGADGLLNALDLSTGATAAGWPLRIVERTDAEYVWGGLSIVGARVYVPVASYCDKSAADDFFADGRLVAVDVALARIVATFDVVPGPNNLGGIWGYAGTSIDPLTGNLWTATGNSWVYDPECDCHVETAGYGESVVVLDRDLNVLAFNRPEGLPLVEDNDFGAAPLLFQPPGCPAMAAANAKNGLVYAWSRDEIWVGAFWSSRVGPDELGSAFIAQPSYSPELNMLFISNARDYDEEGATRTRDAVVALAIEPDCTIPDRPTWTAPGIGRGPKTPALVVDDLVFVPGGFDRNVFALEARTGDTLWSAALPGAVLAPIAYAGDQVLVADASGVLHAFGLPKPTRGAGKIGLHAI